MQRTMGIRRMSTAFIILGLLTATGAAAAVGDHQWSQGFPTGGDFAVDGTNHIVMYGAFFGTIDLGGGPLTSVNFLDGDQYLARFDADGNHLWSLQFSPVGPGAQDEIVTVDSAGNIYVAGKTYNTCTIDFGGGDVDGNSIYVTKFDANGIFQWSGSYGSGWVKDIATNGSHVAVTGYTDVGVDFGGGIIGTAGGYDIYAAKLNAAGAHVWSASYGDASDQGGYGVDLDGAGNVLLAGSVFGTTDFGGGDLAANAADLFVASFNSVGVHNWSRVVDGEITLGGGIGMRCAIAAGPTGEVAVVGDMRNSADFGGGTVTSNGSIDAYCVVYESDGTHRWSANFGSSTSFDEADGVDIDPTGNILIAGTFRGDTDFGGGTVVFPGDPLNFDNGLFVAYFQGDGSHLFSAGYGLKATGTDCGFDSTGDLLVKGSSYGDIDLGGGLITPSGTFIARLEGSGGGGVAQVEDFPRFAGSLAGFPNPFNPMTTIEYVVETVGPVAVAAYDVRGRLVADLVPERAHETGVYQVRFSPGVSGVYFVKMRIGGQDRTLKMVAVK